MSEGFNFINKLLHTEEPALPTALLVVGGLVVLGRRALLQHERAQEPLVPEPRLTIRHLFDVFATFILWLGDKAMGEQNRKYLPFVGTLFLYLVSMNLLGLVPGFSSPTSQFQINLGLALTVFALYTYWGVREVGLVGYFHHLWCFGLRGPLIFLGIMIFPIELLSQVFRPITLSARLFGNMTADHIALSVFTELVPVIVPVLFLLLGTVIAVMQAFVFTLLTMIYIRLGVTHEESH